MIEDKIRYPIGRYAPQESYTAAEIQTIVQRIRQLPARLADVIADFSAAQLDTPYREGGWTVRQVIHHIADSHMNAYIRYKWALTEDIPTIKAYNEKAWAETPENSGDPATSIDLLKALHAKWTLLIETLSPAQLQKQFYHPDTQKHNRLDKVAALYAWHGEHHLAHITELSKNWGK